MLLRQLLLRDGLAVTTLLNSEFFLKYALRLHALVLKLLVLCIFVLIIFVLLLLLDGLSVFSVQINVIYELLQHLFREAVTVFN